MTTLTLNVEIRVAPAGREELLRSLRSLFDEIARRPAFLDATVHTSEDEPDPIGLRQHFEREPHRVGSRPQGVVMLPRARQ